MNFFYEKRPTTSQRATNFGLGKRSDFTRATIDGPSPDRYVQKSDFGNTHVITFGISREASARRFLPNHPPRDRNVPGPAAYTVPPKFQKDSVAFSMRPKTN